MEKQRKDDLRVKEKEVRREIGKVDQSIERKTEWYHQMKVKGV